MAFTTRNVTNTLVDPTNTPIVGLVIQVELISNDPFDIAGIQELFDPHNTYVTDATGKWTAAVVPNDQLRDTGSYYRITEGTVRYWNIQVASGAGAVQVRDVRVDVTPLPAKRAALTAGQTSDTAPVPVTVVGGSTGGGSDVDVSMLNKEVTQQSVYNELVAILNKLISGIGVVGAVEIMNDAGNTIPVSGSVSTNGLTQTQLIAQALHTIVDSVASLPLPAGAATQATLANVLTQLMATLNVNTGLSQPLTRTQLDAALVGVSDTKINARFGVSTGTPVFCSGVGPTTIYTPAAGKRVRVKWIGLSARFANSQAVEATVSWSAGSGSLYSWSLPAGAGFAHGVVREGAVNESLVLTQSASGQTVIVNIDVEEF